MTGFSGLQRLVYASRWADSDQVNVDAVIADILRTSTVNNQRSGVTGLLLFHQRWFLQVLEGPLEAVDDTFDRIRRNPIHTDIRTVADVPVAARSFPDWSMSAEQLAHVEEADLERLGLERDFDPATLDPASAVSLLLSARQTHLDGSDAAVLAERAA